MKMEMWRVYVEQGDEVMWLHLPEACQEREYIVTRDTVDGSMMMMTQKSFDAFYEACAASSPQGQRVARLFLMSAMLTEVEEGRLGLLPSFLERVGVRETELWCVKEEGKEVYHLVKSGALEELIHVLERRAKA